MPAAAQQVLTDGALKPFAADELLAALEQPSGGTSDVLVATAALSPSGCVALRRAVDKERSVTKDSVDKGAEHQLDLSVAQVCTCKHARGPGRAPRST